MTMGKNSHRASPLVGVMKKKRLWKLLTLILASMAALAGSQTGIIRACVAASNNGEGGDTKEPLGRPQSLQFYMHDTVLSGRREQDTSALVAAPRGRRTDTLADQEFHFGDVVVFDDPLTAGPAVASRHVGYAQGVYVYTGRTNYSALWVFTAFLETGAHKGSLTMVGGEIILDPVRFLPVVSGTGDFHMASGMAAISTTKFVGTTFFTLFFNISLSYSC